MATVLSESLEDYLETIFHLHEERYVVRSRDIASEREVSTASVTGALRALARRGLIDYQPYGTITLTPEGHRKGKRILGRHNALGDFLANRLGLSKDKASAVACRMEHAVPGDVMEKMLALFAIVEQCPLATQVQDGLKPGCPLQEEHVGTKAPPPSKSKTPSKAREK